MSNSGWLRILLSDISTEKDCQDGPHFITNVRTLFNNHIYNSSGLGAGQDKNYVDTNEGKLVDAKKQVARYVRLYSNQNNQNDRSHYLEVEVYGRPVVK